NDTELVAINQVASPFNISSNFADETFSGSGSYSKRFRKFQVETSARLGINTFNNQINGEVLESESFTQNYKASLRSNFKTWPNLEIGYDFTSNRYDNG
ncbi:TonB-dependent receptor, partial [Aquimarina celericrescens]|nr:TonB-dependent receptor [Aquimarina celericrescens]